MVTKMYHYKQTMCLQLTLIFVNNTWLMLESVFEL